MASLRDIAGSLRRTLMRRGASTDDADEFVQEALLRYELHRNEVREPERFIVRTALNLANDAARQRRRRASVCLPGADQLRDDAPGPDEIVQARDRLRRLQAGLGQLNPRARRILLSRRLDGLSHAEIAAAEGVSIAAVEKALSRSLAFLMAWMEP